MSHFMVIMPSVGLSDRPPESNVTPLPTSASGGIVRLAAVIARGSPAAAGDPSLRHGQQRPAALGSETLLIPHFASRRRSSAATCAPVGERLGIDVAGRLVHQPPGKRDRFAENPALAEGVVAGAAPQQFRRMDSDSSWRDTDPGPRSRSSRRHSRRRDLGGEPLQRIRDLRPLLAGDGFGGRGAGP